jgi:hypothetical protein
MKWLLASGKGLQAYLLLIHNNDLLLSIYKIPFFQMSLLNKWWYTEYAEEIVHSLQDREKQRIPFFQQSPQVNGIY